MTISMSIECLFLVTGFHKAGRFKRFFKLIRQLERGGGDDVKGVPKIFRRMDLWSGDNSFNLWI